MTYRRPFIGYGLTDVELIPDLNYNITSYFGCYRKDVSKNEKGGTNPNDYFFPYKAGDTSWGCKGSWQGKTGKLFYAQKDPVDSKKEVLDSFDILPTKVNGDPIEFK